MLTYVCFSVLLGTSASVAALEPHFNVVTKNVTVISGQTAVLPCSVDFLGTYKVVWQDHREKVLTLDDRRIISDERISLERPYVKEWNLHVRNVRPDDAGPYTCHLNTIPEQVRTIHLYVHEPASIIGHLSSKQEIVAREGDTVVLVCNVTGLPHPTVTWFRNPAGLLQEGDNEKKPIGVEGEVLVIHNVSRYCDDVYECVAFNDVPPAANRLIRVHVELETTTSAAEVTTSHGHHDITCTESRMEFSIPLSSPHTSETATLSDPNCQINVTRTHVRGGVDLNSCGTTVQFQNDSVIFRNAIIFSAPESSSLGSSGSNSSVSQYQDIIPIQCVYNRIATVHLSYMPVVRRVLFTESGVGQFSFNIQQFWDASFTNMVSDRAYPLRMELDADVFIQLSVGSEGQPVAGHKEIGMEVQQCLVSPSSSVIEAQLHYYPLIQDGCPASSDVHIIPNTNASDSTVMRFRFRAVNFFDPSSSSSSSLVFVHCRMGLCLTGSCKPSAWSCLTPPARRVRRDVDQSKRAAHQLSTGPFLIMADEASTSSSSTTATVMAVVSTSVATVAIVIAAIALIALRRRRTTERN